MGVCASTPQADADLPAAGSQKTVLPDHALKPAAARSAVLTDEERAQESELETNVLSLLVMMDTDKNNGVDAEDLSAVIDENPALRRRLVRNLDLDARYQNDADAPAVAAAIVKAASALSPAVNDWSGESHSIGWYEL